MFKRKKIAQKTGRTSDDAFADAAAKFATGRSGTLSMTKEQHEVILGKRSISDLPASQRKVKSSAPELAVVAEDDEEHDELEDADAA